MKWLCKLITVGRSWKRIRELQRDLYVLGDRRDWDGCNRIEREIARLRNDPFQLSNKDKLDREISRVSKAIKRYENELDNMREQWQKAGALCCPGCMFGNSWNTIVTRCERAEEQLKKLRNKREKML